MLDWQAYGRQFGLGLDRADIYDAMLLSMFFNVHKDKTAEGKPATDFLVWNVPDRLEEEVSREEFVARIRALVRRE